VKSSRGRSIRYVEDVWRLGLCTGCGTCVGVCPNNVLTMNQDYEIPVPTITKSSDCTACNRCIKACPGVSVDFEHLNETIFGKQPKDFQLGVFDSCYLGKTLDQKIRDVYSSGGVISSLLTYLLESGIINGALVTKMSSENPFQTEAFLANTVKEIRQAAGSKYCPVATNTVIKDILRKDGKFAVVGLPCHIQGLRKAESLDPKLKAKIFVHLGLFCGHTVNSFGIFYLLKKLHIEKEDVTQIRYRSHGWPGGLLVELRDKDSIFYPPQAYWNNLFSNFSFTPKRCLLCPDGVNEFADLSFGDAWLPEIPRGRYGTSIIISRTAIGEHLLNLGKSSGKIELIKIKPEKVIQSQKAMLTFKKRKLPARIFAAKMIGLLPPQITVQLPKPLPTDYLTAILPFWVASLSSKKGEQELSRVLGYITRLTNAL